MLYENNVALKKTVFRDVGGSVRHCSSLEPLLWLTRERGTLSSIEERVKQFSAAEREAHPVLHLLFSTLGATPLSPTICHLGRKAGRGLTEVRSSEFLIRVPQFFLVTAILLALERQREQV